jgi:sugar phosphate isomerase/epimerase
MYRDKIRIIHLSDFFDGKARMYVGDGELNFKKFTIKFEGKLNENTDF